jgi:putative tricarboxylic transport membrane protein
MRLKSGQDWATGLLFILVGFGAILTIYFYDKLAMGTTQRPGTGVLPVILSWCLIGTGGLIWIKAYFTGGEPLTHFAWRPLFMVSLAGIAFGRLVDPLGLVVSTSIAVTLCALGTTETRWREFLLFALVLVVIGVGGFIWLLGMPISTWPTRWPDELSFAREWINGNR